MKKLQEKELKAILVIVSGLNIFSYYFNYKEEFTTSKTLFTISIVIGVISLMIPKVGYYIVWLWYKLAEILGWINSRIILSVLFFLFLFPISLMYRLFNKDLLNIKKPASSSMFVARNHQYEAKDFENMW